MLDQRMIGSGEVSYKTSCSIILVNDALLLGEFVISLP